MRQLPRAKRRPPKSANARFAQAFGIKGAARIELKRVLKELEAEGAVARHRKGLIEPGGLPPIVLADILKRDRDGDLIATPVDWNEATDGAPPRILIGHIAKRRPGQPVAGVGDRVLVRADRQRAPEAGEPAYHGRVVKLLERAKMQVVGIFREDATGGGRILPVDKKNASRELHVAAVNRGEARDGDLVAVDLLRDRRIGLPEAKVRERLGAINSEKAISLIAIYGHRIPHVFSP